MTLIVSSPLLSDTMLSQRSAIQLIMNEGTQCKFPCSERGLLLKSRATLAATYHCLNSVVLNLELRQSARAAKVLAGMSWPDDRLMI